MPKYDLRHTLALSLPLIVFPVAAAAQDEPWWHGSFVGEYTTEILINQGHARPFNCEDSEIRPLTITANEISGHGFRCDITKITKIPDYEIVIINSDCEAWDHDAQLPPFKGQRMFLNLEPAGRILAYRRGKIGDRHLPFTTEYSACEWPD
ncbi:MAG: hypothetical protein NXI27_25955 [Alphaproteobacteria bacterium]|nr:hypothetical protein [Alphaproteobacteria bacterium]